MIIGERCQAKHPDKGTQCGLPNGHSGRHQNGTLVPSWDEQSGVVTASTSAGERER
jgi:hypothetical protein